MGCLSWVYAGCCRKQRIGCYWKPPAETAAAVDTAAVAAVIVCSAAETAAVAAATTASDTPVVAESIRWHLELSVHQSSINHTINLTISM